MVPVKLKEEIARLIEAGFSIETEVEGNRVYIIFKDFVLPKDIFNMEKTDLMVWTADVYPSSNFDMFWVNAGLLLANNQVPQSAQSIENYLKKAWRRFSIHPYQIKPWNPMEDDLESYLTYIQQRLKSGK